MVKNSSVNKKLVELVFAYFCPTIIGKACILYFGLNYSAHPGDGYGYGLAISIAVTLIMMARIVIKYWDQEEI